MNDTNKMRLVLKKQYDEYKDKNDWVTVDYDTYVERIHVIERMQENYPYDYDTYEDQDGPTDVDAKSLDQDEWNELIEGFSECL